MELGWIPGGRAFDGAMHRRGAPDGRLDDGLYEAVFRTAKGETCCVALVRDGFLKGASARIDFRGSLHELEPLRTRALIGLRILRGQVDGSTIFGVADQLMLLMHGARLGGHLELYGALPGVPDAGVALSLRPAC